ncbi:unnamed protein product [Ambrosiozyma monospora]|uniref:Unnamed protein product n=1 Tax=Ambrosiozyma monospora TaxID=43982 RepID=A0ACB5TZU0_AMBMO|nr:unnamed protein product [Ambrosiozyma monospora]
MAHPSYPDLCSFSYGPIILCFPLYCFELFEDIKAYKDAQEKVIMFRSDKRVNILAVRTCLPAFDGDELLKLIEELLKLDSKLVPDERCYSCTLGQP